jgi:hypothetical protein
MDTPKPITAMTPEELREHVRQIQAWAAEAIERRARRTPTPRPARQTTLTLRDE